MLVSGDLNLDLRGSQGWPEFIELMRTERGLKLINDLAISTSLNSTCIDVVFSRHTKQLETREHISVPIVFCHVGIISHFTDSTIVNDANNEPALFKSHSLHTINSKYMLTTWCCLWNSLLRVTKKLSTS